MKTDRLTRINELLRREIGVILYRLLDRSQFDLAALTVTHVIINSDLRSARVLISIRGHEHERRAMLARVQHLHGEIQAEIAKVVILKYTPKLQFALDSSIEIGDKVLDILSKLPTAAESAEPDSPDAGATEETDTP
ncbi:MAG: 30S ribosome-binding factor RbfA [bacterium]